MIPYVTRTITCFASFITLSLILCTSISYAQSSVPLIAPSLNNDEATITTQDDVVVTPENIINRIVVDGAKRIEPRTIVDYLDFKVHDAYTQKRESLSIKNLYKTKLFSNVKITRQQNQITVTVEENPVVNTIAFEGNDRIDNNILTAEINIRPLQVFNRSLVKSAVERIIQLYQRKGRFNVVVKPSIIRRDNNRVDVIFDITEGERADILHIQFIGNHYLSDDALRDIILSKQKRWYRFLTNNDRYDPNRLDLDKQLIKNMYNEYGYPDAGVVSAVAELLEDKTGFVLTYTINEGNRYTVTDSLVTSNITGIDADDLLQQVTYQPNNYYNIKDIQATIINMTDYLSEQGFAFIDIVPSYNKNTETNGMAITYNINKGRHVFIERINIKGNVRTIDNVVRRQLLISEGDPYNGEKLNISRRNINNLGFFSKVELNNQDGSAPDRAVLDVVLQEQSTGEISVGAGLSSSDGPLLQLGIQERNLLGEAKTLSLDTSLAVRRQNIVFGYTDKYFLDLDLAAGIDLYHTRTNNEHISSSRERNTGVRLRTGFNYDSYLSQSFFYKLQQTEVTNILSTAAASIQAQAGRTLESTIGQTIAHDTRNSNFEPTDGHLLSLTTEISGLGGNTEYVRAIVNGAIYHTFFDDITAILGAEAGAVSGYNSKKVRLNNRFFLGGYNLRGFRDAGAGPRDTDTDDALGGKLYGSSTLEARFPLGLPEELGVTGSVFNDVGFLTDSEDIGPTIENDRKIRAAIGVGVAFKTPIGPLRFTYAKPYLVQTYDREEFFRFDFSTRF